MVKTLVPLLLLVLLAAPRPARAHCDTLDGPVIADAKAALAKGDPAPVLKWVRPEDEKAIRESFARTAAVRKLSPEARDLADVAFFETLVRLHRAGEGAPYTGLKPAGSADPLFRRADETLAGAPVEPLVDEMTAALARGLKERQARAKALRAAAGDDVAKGREAVAAYVEYLHYVEGLHAALAGASPQEE